MICFEVLNDSYIRLVGDKLISIYQLRYYSNTGIRRPNSNVANDLILQNTNTQIVQSLQLCRY